MQSKPLRPNVVHARLSDAEKKALGELVRIERRSQSEMLRELVREAAQERGLWPAARQAA